MSDLDFVIDGAAPSPCPSPQNSRIDGKTLEAAHRYRGRRYQDYGSEFCAQELKRSTTAAWPTAAWKRSCENLLQAPSARTKSRAVGARRGDEWLERQGPRLVIAVPRVSGATVRRQLAHKPNRTGNASGIRSPDLSLLAHQSTAEVWQRRSRGCVGGGLYGLS